MTDAIVKIDKKLNRSKHRPSVCMFIYLEACEACLACFKVYTLKLRADRSTLYSKQPVKLKGNIQDRIFTAIRNTISDI